MLHKLGGRCGLRGNIYTHVEVGKIELIRCSKVIFGSNYKMTIHYIPVTTFNYDIITRIFNTTQEMDEEYHTILNKQHQSCQEMK